MEKEREKNNEFFWYIFVFGCCLPYFCFFGIFLFSFSSSFLVLIFININKSNLHTLATRQNTLNNNNSLLLLYQTIYDRLKKRKLPEWKSRKECDKIKFESNETRDFFWKEKKMFFPLKKNFESKKSKFCFFEFQWIFFQKKKFNFIHFFVLFLSKKFKFSR